MANLQFLPELVKSKDHLSTVLDPVDALEFFEALNFALSSVDVEHQYGKTIAAYLWRLNQLQAFFALYHADYMNERVEDVKREKF